MGNKSIPEIRFSEFSGDWEEFKLGDVLKERKVKQKISEEAPLLAFAAGQGVIDRSERKTNNRDFLTNDSTEKSYLITKLDDIVYNPSNLKYGAIDRNKHGYGVISPIYVTFETNEIPSFIELIVKSHAFKQRALRYEEGTVTKRQSVKPENLLSLNVVLPNSKNEQTEIGNFFEELEDIITIHKQELDTLKQTKQGFLQKMFPKEGESVPEIRFPGFTGKWEQLKLGDLSESFEYGLNAKAIEFDGENKYIRITDIDDDSHKFSQENLTSPNVTISTADRYLLEPGDILFARTGASVGKSYIYDEKDGKVYYAGFLIRARIKSKYNPEFVFQNTLTEKYNNFIRITSQRSGQPGVNSKEYKGYSIMVPCSKEQKKIGYFLKKIDDTVALHEQELEILKQTKKALLQKMFV